MRDHQVELVPEIAKGIALLAVRETIEQLRRTPLVQPEWLSLQDAAAYCGYSETTFSEFVRKGVAPKSIKFSNNARRFRRADLDAWCLAGGPSKFEPAKKGAVNE